MKKDKLQKQKVLEQEQEDFEEKIKEIHAIILQKAHEKMEKAAAQEAENNQARRDDEQRYGGRRHDDRESGFRADENLSFRNNARPPKPVREEREVREEKDIKIGRDMFKPREDAGENKFANKFAPQGGKPRFMNQKKTESSGSTGGEGGKVLNFRSQPKK